MLSVLGAVGLLALAPVAGAFSTGTTLLNNTNVIQLNGIVVTVTATTNGAGDLVLEYQLTSYPSNVIQTPLGIDKIAWNGPTSGVTISGTAPCSWSAPSSGQMDGFGSFTQQYNTIFAVFGTYSGWLCRIR